MGTDKLQVLYRQRGRWHTIRCPQIDPAITVVERSFNAAVAKAERLFDVEIPVSVEAA